MESQGEVNCQVRTGEWNDWDERRAAVVKANWLFVDNTRFWKKQDGDRFWIAPNANIKSEIDYILINAPRVLKNVSIVPSFDTRSDHRILQARIHIAPAAQKMVLIVSSEHKKPRRYKRSYCYWLRHQLDDGDGYWRRLSLLRWQASSVQKKIGHALARRVQRRSCLRGRAMKRDKMRNVVNSLLYRFIRRRPKEGLEDYHRRNGL